MPDNFSFIKIPSELIGNPQFKALSNDAKLLYAMLLDRMNLSERNGWQDDQGRTYIYYTVDEIRQNLNCGNDKALKILAELDSNKGIGLIERIKQGQGKPTKIFVNRFTTTATIPPQTECYQALSADSHPGTLNPDFPDSRPSLFPTSAPPENRGAEVGKAECNQTYQNQTEFIHTDPPINRPRFQESRRDRYDCREEIRENIEYDGLCRQFGREDVEGMVELMTDVLCSTRPTLRIGGEDIPTRQVQERFQKLDYGHLEYVFDCLRCNTTEIRNIRAYLLTALYNAPPTMSMSYQAQVQHDFGA